MYLGWYIVDTYGWYIVDTYGCYIIVNYGWFIVDTYGWYIRLSTEFVKMVFAKFFCYGDDTE